MTSFNGLVFPTHINIKRNVPLNLFSVQYYIDWKYSSIRKKSEGKICCGNIRNKFSNDMYRFIYFGNIPKAHHRQNEYIIICDENTK